MKHFQRAVWLALALALMMPLAAQAAPGVLDRAIELISVMESSANYGSVANDANGSPSVGILQWNNTRAVELLKKIISDDADAARSILGAKLYAELTEGDAYVWSEKELGDAQKKAVGRLLRTDAGIRRQDEQSLYDVLTYVNRGRSLGIVNPGALVYYADISHQVGIGGARKYAAQAAEAAGGYEKIALEDLHAVGLAIGPNTRTRRNRVYESLLKKQAVDDGAPPESVQIDVPEEQVLYLGEARLLYARLSPSASTAAITWSTSDPDIATVSGGVVTPVAEGTVTISTQAGELADELTFTVLAERPEPTEAPEAEPAAAETPQT